MLAEIIPKIAGMKAEEEWEDAYRPRPSMAGPERCIRSMVYHGLGIPKSPWPGRMVLVVDDSSWHEELTLDWLRQSAFQVHSVQMEIECPPPMTKGSIDGIVTDLLVIDRLLEHKAINHFTFQKYWNNDELPLDYFTQCAIYMNGLKKVNPDIVEGILLIKNKNTSAYLEFLFSYSLDTLNVIKKISSTGEIKEINHPLANIVTQACEKFNQVQNYIEKNTLPKRPYDMDHWRCEYCGWGRECWKNYQEEFQELKTDTILPSEIADMVRFKKELVGHRIDMEKQEKEVTAQIIELMKGLNTRTGRAGEYTCDLKLVETEKINKEKIPFSVLELAKEKGFYEKLNIRKINTNEH